MAGSQILPSLTTGSGPTRLDYWMDLAGQIGRVQTFTVSHAPSTGERSRVILIDDLIDADVDTDEFDGAYVYVMDGEQAGAQRRILSSGYYGGIGGIQVSRTYPAPLAPGTRVAITAPLPVVDHRGVKGLVTCVMEGLKRAWVEGRVALAGDGSQSYDLSTYDFIKDADWTNGIYDWLYQSSTTMPSSLSSYSYEVRVNGATVTLETAFPYSDAVPFELAVFAPADRLLFDGTSWGYITGGLANDTYQGAAPVRWITPLAMEKGLQYLIDKTETDDKIPDAKRARLLASYGRKLPKWAQAARMIQDDALPRPRPDLIASLIGPARVEGSLTWTGPTTLPVSTLP